MKSLKSVCLITPDVARLRAFYRKVLEAEPEGGGAFASFSTPGAGLSLFSTQGLEAMVPGLMDGSGAGSCFLEFEVEDVDREFERLQALGAEAVKPPTTQPWGLRSAWFRDPDGNKLNFSARLPAEAEESR